MHAQNKISPYAYVAPRIIVVSVNYKIECMYCLIPQSPEIKWLSFFLFSL